MRNLPNKRIRLARTKMCSTFRIFHWQLSHAGVNMWPPIAEKTICWAKSWDLSTLSTPNGQALRDDDPGKFVLSSRCAFSEVMRLSGWCLQSSEKISMSANSSTLREMSHRWTSSIQTMISFPMQSNSSLLKLIFLLATAYISQLTFMFSPRLLMNHLRIVSSWLISLSRTLHSLISCLMLWSKNYSLKLINMSLMNSS